MDDLVQWYGQQLDTDERDARHGYYSNTHWEFFTTEAHLHAWKAWREHFPRAQWDVQTNDAISEAARDRIRARITAHEADRTEQVLREIDAKRRMLERHAARYSEPAGGMICAHDGHHWPCPDVRDLAAVYTDRPGYQESWRP